MPKPDKPMPRYHANLRRKHTRRDEAYGVKYWGLGNEVWGEWQVGQQTAAAYATKARQWAHAIRLVDPSVVLVGCGETGINRWDGIVLDELVDKIDVHRCVESTRPRCGKVDAVQHPPLHRIWTTGPVADREGVWKISVWARCGRVLD